MNNSHFAKIKLGKQTLEIWFNNKIHSIYLEQNFDEIKNRSSMNADPYNKVFKRKIIDIKNVIRSNFRVLK